jgi:hypothetical protein
MTSTAQIQEIQNKIWKITNDVHGSVNKNSRISPDFATLLKHWLFFA